MQKGKIHVKGDAGHSMGLHMYDGVILIDGNCSQGYIWFDLKGGTIRIKGNVCGDIGLEMEGGTIYLDGNYESISKDIQGGDIYHKGKLIVKDGVKLWVLN